MRFRKLRITWTVFCGIACVLLIALWVRSQRSVDLFFAPIGGKWCLMMGSIPGACGVSIVNNSGSPVDPVWRSESTTSDKWWNEMGKNGRPFSSRVWGGFLYAHKSSNTGIIIPYWFLIPVALCLSAIPWIPQLRFRFSLLTLLIATTLVAVVLGLVVWLAR